MVDTLRSLARLEVGYKAFHGGATRRRKWRNSRKEKSPRERKRRRRRGRRREGQDRIESAARPVLGIQRGEKNRPGRLTKEALIAAGSRERASRLERVEPILFLLFPNLSLLSLSLSLVFFPLIPSASPWFSRRRPRRHSSARYEIGWAGRVSRKGKPTL